MVKHLSNTIILLYILSNQLLVAQVEELRQSGAFDQACQSGRGPWYFPSNSNNDEREGQFERIDLSPENVSLIDQDGVVCFCEGKSEFSGLVTASNVILYGNGSAETITVSPKMDNYFNLVFLKDDDLERFNEHYTFYKFESKDEKNIANSKDNLELSIRNITFTNSLSRSQSENWLGDKSEAAAYSRRQMEELQEVSDCLNDNLINSLEEDNDPSDCQPQSIAESADSGTLTESTIQGNRPNTLLKMENVIFKQIDNDNLIEYFSDEGVATFKDLQLFENTTQEGVRIGGIRELSLFNIALSKNTSTNLNFFNNQNVSLDDISIENGTSLTVLALIGNFNQSLSNIKMHRNKNMYLAFMTRNPMNARRGEGKLNISNLDVSNNEIFNVWFYGQDLKSENIIFNNNQWNNPLLLTVTDKKPFEINKLGFLYNQRSTDGPIGFGVFIVGSGSINNFTFENNQSDFFPITLHSSKMVINKSFFGENKVLTPYLILQIGNIEYHNSVFQDTYYSMIYNDPKLEDYSKDYNLGRSVIYPRYIYDGNINFVFNDVREDPTPYRMLRNHKITMKNVRMNLQRKVVSIFAINDLNRHYAFTNEMENGDGIPFEWYEEGANNNLYSIYRFEEIENQECAFVDDVYRCQ